jgi:hypothetical protein
MFSNDVLSREPINSYSLGDLRRDRQDLVHFGRCTGHTMRDLLLNLFA